MGSLLRSYIRFASHVTMFLLIPALVLPIQPAHCQSPPLVSPVSIVWEASYGVCIWPSGIVRSEDGGYVVAGGRWYRTGSAIAYDSIYLLKVDNDGEKVWEKIYGKVGNDRALATGLVESGDGGYVVAGSTRSRTTGNWSTYVLKTDTNGEEVWERYYPGDQDDLGSANRIARADDGGFVILGASNLLKIDSSGEKVWERPHRGDARSITETGDGGFVVLSRARGTYLLKIDGKGNTVWERSYAAPSEPWRAIRSSAGGFVVAGGEDGCACAYLCRLDENGTLVWGGTYPGSAKDFSSNSAFVVSQSEDGGLMASGSMRLSGGARGIWIAFISPEGEKIWDAVENRTESIGLPGFTDYVSAIREAPEGGFVLAAAVSMFRIMIPERCMLVGLVAAILLLAWRRDGGVDHCPSPMSNRTPMSQSNPSTANGQIVPESLVTRRMSAGNRVKLWVVSSRFIILLCIFVSLVQVSGQMKVVWEKKYDYGRVESANKILRCPDGGFLIAGTYGDPAGSTVILKGAQIIRVNSKGDLIWQVSYVPEGSDQASIGDAVDSGDGFIITGDIRSLYTGKREAFLLKISQEGEKLWERNYKIGESTTVRSMIRCGYGRYLLVGGASWSMGQERATYLLKVDQNGDTLWNTTSTSRYTGDEIIKANDDGYLVVGTFLNSTRNPEQDQDIYLLKVTESGKDVWERSWTFPGIDDDPTIAPCPDGGYLIACRNTLLDEEKGTYTYSLITWKTNIKGQPIWSKTYSEGDSFGAATRIARIISLDDGYLLAGSRYRGEERSYDGYLVRINQDGDRLWEMFHGTNRNEAVRDMQASCDGAFVCITANGGEDWYRSDVGIFEVRDYVDQTQHSITYYLTRKASVAVRHQVLAERHDDCSLNLTYPYRVGNLTIASDSGAPIPHRIYYLPNQTVLTLNLTQGITSFTVYYNLTRSREELWQKTFKTHPILPDPFTIIMNLTIRAAEQSRIVDWSPRQGGHLEFNPTTNQTQVTWADVYGEAGCFEVRYESSKPFPSFLIASLIVLALLVSLVPIHHLFLGRRGVEGKRT